MIGVYVGTILIFRLVDASLEGNQRGVSSEGQEHDGDRFGGSSIHFYLEPVPVSLSSADLELREPPSEDASS